MTDILCQISHLGVRFNDAVVFSDVNHSLTPGLTGLVAANGRGKSVLLRALAGRLPRREGTVHWRVPHRSVDQLQRLNGPRLADALGVGVLFDCFRRIERGLAGPDDLDRVADLWHLPGFWRALLDGAALSQSLADPVGTLSGGEQTRLALCTAFANPDCCLLLDEPGNHLDAQGRDWLLEQLARHPGGALIASHDRALLRGMDRILELTPTGLVEYGGGYDLYRSVKSAQVEALEHKVEHLSAARRKQRQAQQASLEKAAGRRKQGERERRSGSQGKMLMDKRKERSESSLAKLKQQQRHSDDQLNEALRASKTQLEQQRDQRMVLPTAGLRGGVRLHLEQLVLPHGDPAPLSMTVHSGERWRIGGANGSGKSTLLKVIAGELAPAQGDCRVHGTRLYLDQHYSLLEPAECALANLRRAHPQRSESDIRTLLAGLGLRGDKALVPVAQLSGGERLKVALLAVTGGERAPDLLLLDEPDNHLDLDSRRLLEHALSDYPGTLLVVSHDADFIEALAPDRTVTLRWGGGADSS